ncbi:MAG: tRNA-2-methylthio-N(6)-dimethylallyladenosine synthase [Desulfovibrio sp.]
MTLSSPSDRPFTPSRRVAFAYSGVCARRGLELVRVRRYLERNGYATVDYPEPADILFFYGCAINRDNEMASLAMLTRLAREFSEIFVLGGVVEICPARDLAAAASSTIVHRVSLRRCEDLDPFFARSVPFAQMKKSNFSFFLPEHWSIQVGRGCNSRCSYCGDKKIVGPLQSVPREEIVRQFREGLERGHTRFDLVGDDVGAWGMDLRDGLCPLLKELAAHDGDFSISMQEVNIRHLIRSMHDFEQVLATGKLDSMALAFQHVNDRILKLMNRGYDGKGVRKLASLLREHDIRVHFHAILGFPTESRAEMGENLDFMASHRFATGSYFLYQAREYAPSSKLDGHLSPAEQTDMAAEAQRILAGAGYEVIPRFPGKEHLDAFTGPPDKLQLRYVRGEDALPSPQRSQQCGSRRKNSSEIFSSDMPTFVRGKPLPDYGPFSVYGKFRKIILEQTAHCPNSCVFCHFRQREAKGTMAVSDLQHLLRCLPSHSGMVELSGNGEPLVLDDLSDRARLIRQAWPEASLSVLTSLSIPRDASYFISLFRSGVSRLDISCYGHTAEDYHLLHGRNAFDDVRRNIAILGECARRFNADVILHTFLSTDTLFGITESDQKRDAFEVVARKNGIRHSITKEVYSGQGRLRLPGVETAKPPWPCSAVWGHRAGELMIGWDLEVWPCCFMPEKQYSLGNLRETTLARLYVSPRYREFHESHWIGDLSLFPCCAQCTHPNHQPSREELTRLAAYEGHRLAGQEVYFWGCGEAYRMRKIFFAQTKPRCILYDAPGERPDEVDGIMVRHPDDVLLSEEKLPLIIFAAPEHNTTILETLGRRYPEYGPDDIILCTAAMK